MKPFPIILAPLAVLLFSVFPLTDTDIWWHLACAREWVTTWTPVRSPVINGHVYFQAVVGAVYGVGGAVLLVAFKALLWSAVFALFLFPLRKRLVDLRLVASLVAILFCLRYQFEMRPVVFSMLFLGLYWNLVPRILNNAGSQRIACVLSVLLLQWLWCRFQGLYILGPVFVGVSIACRIRCARKDFLWQGAFILALLAMPFLHRDGLLLFLYPFGLLDRLVGLSESAAVFASHIAENRSPFTLLFAGENTFAVVVAMAAAVLSLFLSRRSFWKSGEVAWLCITAVLAMVAERNIVLFLPAFCYFVLSDASACCNFSPCKEHCRVISVSVLALILGLWCRSLLPYDMSMVSGQRVPVAAAAWMASHPHEGRLFNDDRSGGYLAFVNPQDSTYLDGRFFLKTSSFFERYLQYAESPSEFMKDMDSLGVDRALFPLRHYTRWDGVIQALTSSAKWRFVYVDSAFVVLDRKNLR